MPLLFALGQHKSLVEAQARLSGKRLLAFLDDIYITSMPDRVSEAHNIVEEELSTHAHIHLHHGQTKVWNRGGVKPEGVAELTRRARQVRPDAVVWKGDQQLPPNHSVPTHPMGTGHSGSLLAPLHVRFHEG